MLSASSLFTLVAENYALKSGDIGTLIYKRLTNK